MRGKRSSSDASASSSRYSSEYTRPESLYGKRSGSLARGSASKHFRGGRDTTARLLLRLRRVFGSKSHVPVRFQ